MQTKQLHAPVLENVTSKFVKSLDKPDAKPIYKLSVEDARKVLLDVQSQAKEMKNVDIEQRSIQAGPSGKLSLTLIRPKGVTTKLPALMYFCGGGWILGNFKTHERLVRELASQAECLVVFVNYTPSPEAKFPTAIEELYAATKYVAEHNDEFNIVPGKLAIAGDSVGGNMSIAVSLMAKERGGPAICRQVLFYPVTDASLDTESYSQFADGPWLTKPAMEWFWNAYAPEKNTRADILASPLRAPAEKLKGLPPALVITAENDVLRDEGESYARKLMEAGVPVTAMRYLGTVHDFLMLNALADTPAAKDGISAAVDALTRSFK
jgi:acetyl esterase